MLDAGVPPALLEITARRRARRAFGAVLILGFAAIAVISVFAFDGFGSGVTHDLSYTLLSCLLAGQGVAAVSAYAVTRRRARRSSRQAVAAVPSSLECPSDEVRQNLAARAIAESAEAAGLAVPLAGAALAWSTVLLSGVATALMVIKEHRMPSPVELGGFLALWTLVTGHGAVALAITAYLEGKSMAVSSADATRARSLRWHVFVIATVVGAIPAGALHDGIPVIYSLYAVTAFAFGAFTFLPALVWARLRLHRERATIRRTLVDGSTATPREKLIPIVLWAEAPVSARLEALRYLAAEGDAELPRLVERALADPNRQLVHSALELCRARHLRPGLEPLLALVESCDHAAAVFLPRLLGRHRDGRVEGALLALLARPNLHVQRAAAETLGLVGSLSAVEPLRATARSLDPRIRAAAEEAIERIGLRMKGGRGQLSLLDEDGHGELSLAASEAGALSSALPVQDLISAQDLGWRSPE